MTRKAWILLICAAFTAAACTPQGTPAPTSTPAPSATPTATATPVPILPETLDWHIQFASDQDIELFRCQVLEGVDVGTRNLMEPVSARLTAVIVTPQMLDEAIRIFQRTNPALVASLKELRENLSQVIVLLQMSLLTDRSLYEPYAMLIPRSGEPIRTLNSLSELRFGFGATGGSRDLLVLHVGDLMLAPTVSITSLELEPEQPYIFTFESDSLNPQALFSNEIRLSARMEMLVPFVIDTCETDHYRNFDLSFSMVDGDSLLLPQLFGANSGAALSQEEIDRFRLLLLSSVLPRLTALETPQSSPTATLPPTQAPALPTTASTP